MKILGMILDGIQTYHSSTFIPFSDLKTIVKGGNDKGKSVIKKALGVFANIYSTDDLSSLINYDRNEAQIALFLSNRTVMTAYLTGKSITYRLYTWQLDICLREWVEYNQEISKYLGWVTVPGEELCINLAESDVNVLVNTSKTTNTQIIKSISTIPELDMKLENLKNALEEAKETNKWATAEVRVQETYCTFNERKYESIKATREQMLNCRSRIEATLQVANILYTVVDLHMKLLEQKINEYNKLNCLCKVAKSLSNLLQLKGYTTKMKNKMKNISELSNSMSILQSLKGKYKALQTIRDNKLKAYNIEHNLNTLKSTTHIPKLLCTRYIYQQQLQLSNVSRARILLNQLKSQKITKNFYDEVLNLKTQSQLYNTLHNLNNALINKIKNNQEMSKFDVCPLCHQPIGGSEHGH